MARENNDAWVAEEPLSPAARLFHSPEVNCYIVAIMGCKKTIVPGIIKEGLENTLLKHPRFCSKLVEGKGGRKEKWIRTQVNVEDHVIVPNLGPNIEDPDEFVENYISNITKTPLDLSKPLWELHLLNIRTKDAEAMGIFRIHHSMGDGASLISLLLACTRKTSDPDALPTVPEKNRASLSHAGGFWWLFLAIWSVLTLIWNTLVDVAMFTATSISFKDTNSPIKGAPGVELNTKRFVFRTLRLDQIKQLKDDMNMTINDVLLGITQGGLSRYLNRRYGEAEDDWDKQKRNHLPQKIRLRASILVNIRETAGIQALADMMAKGSKAGWGNWIGYVLLPFNIALQDNPLDYVHQAKGIIDRKKHSLEAMSTFTSAKLTLRTFGVKATARLTHKVLSNTTMSFSNLIGPIEEISFYGHPIAYLAPSVYGHPQALTIHFQSYANKMVVVLAVDPTVIPDPHRLLDDLEESLKLISEAAIKKGQVKPVS